MASNLDYAEDIEEAKAYMAKKNVFQLFESLLTAVVHNRPEDPVQFLQECLETAKQNTDLRWNSFIHVRDKKRKSSHTGGQFDKVFDTELDSTLNS
ncbi:adenylate kinase isoenzyme 5-like [Acropora millepora]|nr:adenylate kinase isoenzyme 5-like [Acropora millepora]